MLSGRDQDTIRDESLTLIFATLAVLASRSLAPDDAAREDLIRALQACAKHPGLKARRDLTDALNAFA